MNSSSLSSQWLHSISMLMILSFSLMVASAGRLDIPRLSPFRTTILGNPNLDLSSKLSTNDSQIFYYKQTLDHFNYQPQSYVTFKQKYIINSKYWGGANSSDPIFVYLGAESELGDAPVVGFLENNAGKFKALLVYIEHRYYGESMPFGSFEEAFKNASTLGYFSSAQAIQDYAQIIMHVKKKYHARFSPVIVVGGSYGGMLASWFRLKYPHVALGAVASSAPILYFENITPSGAYYSRASKDFREASESCYETIKKSWSEIDKIASKPDGLSKLSNIFKTCKSLKSSRELKDFLDLTFTGAAQYNSPPRYPVNVICDGIDGSGDEDILNKVVAGLVAYSPFTFCFETQRPKDHADLGWDWQTCSEMVMPIGSDEGNMFETDPFNLTLFIDYCYSKYSISPRPHWVTSYYGGHDIALVLKRFGSNIIFSNGLRDPYSTGGVLKNISSSIIALTTVNGSHCLDIVLEKETDPKWLIEQRRAEVKIIKGWLAQYYVDLKAYYKHIKYH